MVIVLLEPLRRPISGKRRGWYEGPGQDSVPIQLSQGVSLLVIAGSCMNVTVRKKQNKTEKNRGSKR